MSKRMSMSRAVMRASASKPVRTVTSAPSARVVYMAASTSVVTLTGRPAAHDAAAARGSSLV